MSRDTTHETWLFRVELPAGIEHGGRFMARLLKHLLRAWVRCVGRWTMPKDRTSPR